MSVSAHAVHVYVLCSYKDAYLNKGNLLDFVINTSEPVEVPRMSRHCEPTRHFLAQVLILQTIMLYAKKNSGCARLVCIIIRI